MKKFLLLVLLLNLTHCTSGGLVQKTMDQKTMEQIIKAKASSHQGENGVVEFDHLGVKMAVISDPKHDRMRIIAPIKKYSELRKAQIDASMEANFHSALDARYATSGDVLYAAFIHPLSPLDKIQIETAMDQVANLAMTFGTKYSGGTLVFGGGKAKNDAETKKGKTNE